MKITLVRHSEVIKEYQGKYNGHIDISLSDKGRSDAKELANKLQNIKFDKIYCSDLLRAKETLEAFEYTITPIYTKDLREKSWGQHEGKSFEEIQSEGIEYKNFEQWISALDGEEFITYKERLQNYFYKTILKQDCENILVITHSGVIKTILSIVKNITLEEAFSSNLDYSSYITLDYNTIKIVK